MSDLRVHKTKYINETKRVSFKYDGKNYFGYEGDTLRIQNNFYHHI